MFELLSTHSLYFGIFGAVYLNTNPSLTRTLFSDKRVICHTCRTVPHRLFLGDLILCLFIHCVSGLKGQYFRALLIRAVTTLGQLYLTCWAQLFPLGASLPTSRPLSLAQVFAVLFSLCLKSHIRAIF